MKRILSASLQALQSKRARSCGDVGQPNSNNDAQDVAVQQQLQDQQQQGQRSAPAKFTGLSQAAFTEEPPDNGNSGDGIQDPPSRLRDQEHLDRDSDTAHQLYQVPSQQLYRMRDMKVMFFAQPQQDRQLQQQHLLLGMLASSLTALT